jgi:predicted double-glycine peptidase
MITKTMAHVHGFRPEKPSDLKTVREQLNVMFGDPDVAGISAHKARLFDCLKTMKWQLSKKDCASVWAEAQEFMGKDS